VNYGTALTDFFKAMTKSCRSIVTQVS
jgi:hypothetical protein